MGNEWFSSLDIDDLVPYSHPSAAWTDRHSTLVLCWPDEARIGLQQLQILYGWGGTKITDSLLTWELTEGGSPIEVTLASRTFRPDRVLEVNHAEGLTLTATAAYAERNAIGVEFVLENTDQADRSIKLSFAYPGKGIKPDWEGMFKVGTCVEVETAAEGSWSTLFRHAEHGRNFGWVSPYVSGVSDGTSFELICLTDCSPCTLHVPAGGTASTNVFLAFALNRGRADRLFDVCESKRVLGWKPSDEHSRLANLVAGASELPERFGDDDHRRMYVHAIAGLNGLFVRGDGGYTGSKRLPWTTTFQLAIPFFWDTAFSVMGALEFDPELCRESVRCFTENPSPRGGLPGTICDTHRAGEGQAPIMSWAAWLTYKKSRDLGWLRDVYPKFCDFNRYWFRYHASERGLAMYYNAGQIGDNDVRFDAQYGRPQGNEPLYGFESPDLNSFFVIEMHCLAKMADALGLEEEAIQWRKLADELASLIVEACYFPGDATFFDVVEGTREPFSRTKGPNMFLPLLAGVPLEEDEVARIIERHMLNPDEFFRELPFPSVSYDNPQYDPNGYWRGRIWPHIVFLMIQILWKYGYHAEADRTAGNLIALFRQTPWFHENYNSAEAQGLGLTEEGYAIGFPEYNWSQATVIRLLLERYKDPVF